MLHGKSPRAAGLRAFTLAELLIVIAIIGVLIAILLPSLSAARRSAASVKCLASLKQIGSAFQQYAQDNRRAFPVVRWAAAPSRPLPGPNTTERTWMDFIARYVNKTETNGDPAQFAKIEWSSVLWGCPAYDHSQFDATGNTERKYSLGYGMNRFPLGPYKTPNYPTGQPTSQAGTSPLQLYQAIVSDDPATPSTGSFFKMEQWGRHGQDKGLVADSLGFNPIVSGSNASWSRAEEAKGDSAALISTEPAKMGLDYTGLPMGTGSEGHGATLPGGAFISLDSTRHLPATNSKGKAFKNRGINMLFVDGHASSVTPREAYIAFFGAGVDITAP